jgi:hypothetical protein
MKIAKTIETEEDGTQNLRNEKMINSESRLIKLLGQIMGLILSGMNVVRLGCIE